MKKLRKNHRQWLDKNNHLQMEFTRKYLNNAGWLIKESTETDQLYEELIQALEAIQGQSANSYELIDTLRRKWREEKIKINHDMINIRITKIASKQLKLLSKEKPKNKVIEDMILKEGRSLAHYNRQVTEIRKEFESKFKKKNLHLQLKYARLEDGLANELEQDAISVNNRNLTEELAITQLHLYRVLEELARQQAVITDNNFNTTLLTENQKTKFDTIFASHKEKYLEGHWRHIESRIEGFVSPKDFPCPDLEFDSRKESSEPDETPPDPDPTLNTHESLI